MDYASVILLLSMGFVVGLSGAMMPGPLLIYTINESMRKGRWTGALVILGHAIVEVCIFLLLLYGLLEYLATDEAITATTFLGGITLILMGLFSLKDLKTKQDYSRDNTTKEKTKYGIIASGMIFSAFNPGFPVWWATAGTSLLMAGYKELGTLGMILVLVGHWGADLGWFLFVSTSTEKGSKYIFERGWYRKIRIILSGLLFLIGLYFLSTLTVLR